MLSCGEVRLVGCPESVREVRGWVGGRLRVRGVAPGVVAAAEQVCSELASVAVSDCVPGDPDGDYSVVLAIDYVGIRIEVTDPGATAERIPGLRLTPLPLSGLALLLVQSHVSAWWVETAPNERTVCAEISTLVPNVGTDA